MTEALTQAEELRRLKANVRMLLDKIEWSGHADLFQCPDCGASQVAGHEPNCLLAQVAKAVEKVRRLMAAKKSTKTRARAGTCLVCFKKSPPKTAFCRRCWEEMRKSVPGMLPYDEAPKD